MPLNPFGFFFGNKKVASTAPTNGQVPTYDLASDSYIPATPPGAGGGEANTASNLGTGADGEGLVGTKVGVDLPFRRIKAGSNITLTATANSIEVASTGGGGSSDERDAWLFA